MVPAKQQASLMSVLGPLRIAVKVGGFKDLGGLLAGDGTTLAEPLHHPEPELPLSGVVVGPPPWCDRR